MRRPAAKTRPSRKRPADRPRLPAVGPLLAQPTVAHWAGPALVGPAAIGMLAWTWETWPDVLTDIGQQVYLPWQLAEGRVLYRDLAFYNGPLSQYFNALMFRALGSSLGTYFVTNLGILVAFLALCYYVMRQVSSRAAATLGCLFFVLLFAFGHFTMIGGYNWVSPYTPEVTHGLTLGLAALAAVWRYRGEQLGWLVTSGLLAGATFLTKAELSLGALAAVTVALGLTLITAGVRGRRLAIALATFAAAAIAPVVLAIVCLWRYMPLATAVQGALGSWLVVASGAVTSLQFHRHNMGLAYPQAALHTMAVVGAVYLLFLVPAIVVALVVRPGSKARTYAARAGVLAASGLLVVLGWSRFGWEHAARPFSLVMLLLSAAFAVQWFCAVRGDADVETRHMRLRQASLAVLAFGVLLKIVLNCHIYHYGFVLAVPAMLVMLALVWDWLPAAIERRSADGMLVRLAVVPPLVGWLVFNLGLQAQVMQYYTVPVARGADSFTSDARGEYVNVVLEWLEANTTRETTLAALPAGVMIGFLARRADPTPYTQITPTEVALYGEETILAGYRANPPEVIALVHADFYEFGSRFFGRDYGQTIYQWIEGNYTPVGIVGEKPLTGDRFGIQLFRRNRRRKTPPGEQTSP